MLTAHAHNSPKVGHHKFVPHTPKARSKKKHIPAKPTKKAATKTNRRDCSPIPVAFHPAIKEAHIIGGNSDAHSILTALFKSCGWKVYTKSPKRQKPAPKRKSQTVTHSHFEKRKKK